MARRKARRSTIYIVSVGAHLALGLAIALIPKDKLREVVGIAMAEAKKPPPKAEPPPKREETQRARPARNGGQKSARAASAGPDTSQAAAAAPVFTDIGIALDSSAVGGLAMQIAPKAVEKAAPAPIEPARPKVLMARIGQEACNEPIIKARVLRQAQPKYPAAAASANVRGVVRLDLEIDDKGVVRNVRVLRGLGHGLDESAIEAAKRVEFKPATLCGKAVSSQFTLAFRY
jgi:protein TonB